MKLKKLVNRAVTELRARILMWAVKQWSEKEMDQWENFYMKTKFGKLYVSLAYQVEYEDSYNNWDKS